MPRTTADPTLEEGDGDGCLGSWNDPTLGRISIWGAPPGGRRTCQAAALGRRAIMVNELVADLALKGDKAFQQRIAKRLGGHLPDEGIARARLQLDELEGMTDPPAAIRCHPSEVALFERATPRDSSFSGATSSPLVGLRVHSDPSLGRGALRPMAIGDEREWLEGESERLKNRKCCRFHDRGGDRKALCLPL